MDNDQKQPEINEDKITEIMKELSVVLQPRTVADLEELKRRIDKLLVLRIEQRKLYEEEMRLVGWDS